MSTKMNSEQAIDMDEMDIIMSQIDNDCFQTANAFDENVLIIESSADVEDASNEFDEMDAIMSQMGDDIFINGAVEVGAASTTEECVGGTIEGDIPEELLREYETENDDLDEALVRKMQNEPDDEPAEISEEFQNAMNEILAAKSRNRYLQAYDVFVKWQQSHGVRCFSEKVVMAYLIGLSRKYKPPTLWSIYSLLKKTFIIKQNIDMTKYCRLRAFLKRKCDGYESKKSNVFTPEEVNKFIVEAPNSQYLGMKVVLIFGLNGTLRGAELTDLCVHNVKDDGKEIRVILPKDKTKTKKAKEYIIYMYMNLRPADAKTDRLFLQWRNGKCVRQVMGKHSIRKIPKQIDTYLNLPEPTTYTGHSYRRTSTTVAVDEGCSIDEVKRIGPWESTKVAERYVQDSLARKRKVAKMFSNAINLPYTNTFVESGADETNRNNTEPVQSLSKLPFRLQMILSILIHQLRMRHHHHRHRFRLLDLAQLPLTKLNPVKPWHQCRLVLDHHRHLQFRLVRRLLQYPDLVNLYKLMGKKTSFSVSQENVTTLQ